MTKSAACILALMGIFVCAVEARSETVPFDSNRWEIQAAESKVVDHLGRRSLYLKGGIAAVKDAQLADGVLEFDMAFGPERGFKGAIWRMQDFENYEEFYVRPHQSGNPDANQYQPVFNGNASWQLYYGPAWSSPIRYEFGRWIHVKIVFVGARAEVYVDDMETPALVVGEMKRDRRAGRVGLSADNFSPAYFANFSYSEAKGVSPKGTAKEPEPAPPGAVMSWAISSPVDGRSLDRAYELSADVKRGLSWERLACESTGLANIARLHGVAEGRDTVFAKLTIRSDREQVKRVKFGFSDAVRVYLNDRLVYAGGDSYVSRDYRFLGTIGLYDELYLPLRKGDNEVWFAVTETFGGWGIKATVEDRDGIAVIE